ncbi:MAG TPA: RDD family protein [Paracoccaceae bacterium]|nr:RDD family protein [Paracoccaceae bacterium]
MTHYADNPSGLPDPDAFPQFYDGVPTRRLVAWLFDIGITFALTMVLVVMTLGLALFIIPFVWLAVGFFYRTTMIGMGSATVGMRLVGIELRNRDGRRFDIVQAAVHTLVYTIATGSVLLQLLSVGLMLTSRYGQGLPDILLGSTAINRP